MDVVISPSQEQPTTSRDPVLSPTGPQVMFRAGRVAGVLLVGVQVALLALISNPWPRTIVNDLMAATGTLVAFLGLTYGAYWTARQRPQAKTAWRFMACAGGCMALGGVSHFVYEAILRQPASPTIADLFILASYPLFMAAILTLPGERLALHELGKLIVDSAIIVFASTLVIGMTIIQPVLRAGYTDFTAMAVAIAYPVGDLILVWALLTLILRQNLVQPRQPIWLIFSAGAFIILGDFLATGTQAQAVYPSSSWLYVFYLLCPLALMFAGLLQALLIVKIRPDAGMHLEPRFLVLPTFVRLAAPYLLLAITYYFIWNENLDEPMLPRPLLFGWGGVVFGLVVLRQVITLLENQHLTQDLNRLNGELEDRVEQRTQELVHANHDLRQEMDQRVRAERALREREEKMAYNATHDALTGLANRMFFLAYLDQDILRAKTEASYRFALLYLDFDSFKTINDSLGHPAGDQLLLVIAHRLQSTLRPGDSAARLGGDEFAILMENLAEQEDLCQYAKALMEALARPFEIAGHRIFLTASIGVVSCDPSYHYATEILRDADLAMYEAKAQGKARYVVFQPRMRKYAMDRLVLESDLRTALESNEFRLEYLPIKSLVTGQLTGFEALIRWSHPERGIIPPEEFLPVAETTGQILPITRWVLQEACSQARIWQQEFPAFSSLSIDVNLAPKAFASPELPVMIDAILAETGLPPSSLRLDITEAVFQNDLELLQRTLNAWHARGVRIQMDDFGMNFASLGYLRRYPIDTLKVVQPFVRRIHGEGDQGEIVRAILSIANELHLEVIAGGVETAAQFAFLKEVGCQFAQGFFISEPLAPQNAWMLLATGAIEPARIE